MKGTVFYKMTGSGNDFIFLDGRTTGVEAWTADAISSLCARGTGIGADGLVIIARGDEAGVVRFSYFNADGGQCDMCGNAALCATILAARLELAPPESMVLATDAGPIGARVINEPCQRAEVEMPAVSELTQPEIDRLDGEKSIHLMKVGVPHLIVRVDDVTSAGVVTGRGQELRGHPSLGAEGANVNFVGQIDGLWRMRTYERGVEAETLACGTGAVAVATTLASLREVQFPCRLRTSSGSDLEVTGTLSSDDSIPIVGPRLSGEGRVVYRGILH